MELRRFFFTPFLTYFGIRPSDRHAPVAVTLFDGIALRIWYFSPVCLINKRLGSTYFIFYQPKIVSSKHSYPYPLERYSIPLLTDFLTQHSPTFAFNRHQNDRFITHTTKWLKLTQFQPPKKKEERKKQRNFYQKRIRNAWASALLLHPPFRPQTKHIETNKQKGRKKDETK